MAGHYIARTPLAVDFWRRKTCEAKLFFLSHMHSDHTDGLTSSWDRTIYCSEITKSLAVTKLNLIPSLLVTIPIGQSTILDIDETGVEKVTVTLIDANHCPGAVMFLFEGYFGRILYTGDSRYRVGMLDIPQFATNPIVNDLYLDNTYCDPSCEFPPKEAATLITEDILENYHKEMYFIVIGMDSLGKEDLLYRIAVKLRAPIIVDEFRLQTTKLLGLDSVFTTDVNASNIRVVPKREVTQQHVTFWNRQQPTIAILPTCLYEGTFNPHAGSENIFVIPYSDHSSFLEMLAFVGKVRPQRVIPIVNMPTRSDDSASRLDMSVFSEQISSDIVPHKFEIPLSVQTFMLKNNQIVNRPTSQISVRRKRRPFSHFYSKPKKACGVVFPSSKNTRNTPKTPKNANSGSEKELVKSGGECSGFAGASTSSVEVLQNMESHFVVQDQRDDDKSQEETQAAKQVRFSEGPTKIQAKESRHPQAGPAEEPEGVEEMDYQPVVLSRNQQKTCNAKETRDTQARESRSPKKILPGETQGLVEKIDYQKQTKTKQTRGPQVSEQGNEFNAKIPLGETQGLRVEEINYLQKVLNGNEKETKSRETRDAKETSRGQGSESKVRESRSPKKILPGETQGLPVEKIDYQQKVLNGNQKETKSRETRDVKETSRGQGSESKVRESRSLKKTPPGETQGLRVEKIDYQQKVLNGKQTKTKQTRGPQESEEGNEFNAKESRSPEKIPLGETQGLRVEEINYLQKALNGNQKETKSRETRDAKETSRGQGSESKVRESRSLKKTPPGETQGLRVEKIDYQQKVLNGNQKQTKTKETRGPQESEEGNEFNAKESRSPAKIPLGETQGLRVEEINYLQKVLNGNEKETKSRETRDAKETSRGQGSESKVRESRSPKKILPGETQGLPVEKIDYQQKVLNGNQKETKSRETRDVKETSRGQGSESKVRESRSLKKTPPGETQGLRVEKIDYQQKVLNGKQTKTKQTRGPQESEEGNEFNAKESRSPEKIPLGETQGLRVEEINYLQKALNGNQKETKSRETRDAKETSRGQGSESKVRESRSLKKTPPGETQGLRVEKIDYQQKVLNGNQKQTKTKETRGPQESEEGNEFNAKESRSPAKIPLGETQGLRVEEINYLQKVLNGNQKETKSRETRDAKETSRGQGSESKVRESRSLKKTPPGETQGLRVEERDYQPFILNGNEGGVTPSGMQNTQKTFGEQGDGSQARESRSLEKTPPEEICRVRVERMDYQKKVLNGNEKKAKARETRVVPVNLDEQGSKSSPKKTPPEEICRVRVEIMDYQKKVLYGNEKKTKARETRVVPVNLDEQGSKSSPKKIPDGEAKQLQALESLRKITEKTTRVVEKRGHEENLRENKTEASEKLRKHRMEQLGGSGGFYPNEMGCPREPTEKRGREKDLREKRTETQTRKSCNHRETEGFHSDKVGWPREILHEDHGEISITEKRGYEENLRGKRNETRPRKSRIRTMTQPEVMDCSREIMEKRCLEENLREKSGETQPTKSRKHRMAQHGEADGLRADEMGCPREIEQEENRITEKRGRPANEKQSGQTRAKRTGFEGAVAERREECYSKETNDRPKACYETPRESSSAGMKCLPETLRKHEGNANQTQKSRETSSNRESEPREGCLKDPYCVKKRNEERSSSIYDGPCVFALDILQKLKSKRQSK